MTQEEHLAAEVLVTGIREPIANNNPYLSSDFFYFWDSGVAYQASRYALPPGLQPLIDLFTADDDGDGTSNLFDDFHGFNDATVVVVATTQSQIMAKVGDNVYTVLITLVIGYLSIFNRLAPTPLQEIKSQD